LSKNVAAPRRFDQVKSTVPEPELDGKSRANQTNNWRDKIIGS